MLLAFLLSASSAAAAGLADHPAWHHATAILNATAEMDWFEVQILDVEMQYCRVGVPDDGGPLLTRCWFPGGGPRDLRPDDRAVRRKWRRVQRWGRQSSSGLLARRHLGVAYIGRFREVRLQEWVFYPDPSPPIEHRLAAEGALTVAIAPDGQVQPLYEMLIGSMEGLVRSDTDSEPRVYLHYVPPPELQGTPILLGGQFFTALGPGPIAGTTDDRYPPALSAMMAALPEALAAWDAGRALPPPLEQPPPVPRMVTWQPAPGLSVEIPADIASFDLQRRLGTGGPWVQLRLDLAGGRLRVQIGEESPREGAITHTGYVFGEQRLNLREVQGPGCEPLALNGQPASPCMFQDSGRTVVPDDTEASGGVWVGRAPRLERTAEGRLVLVPGSERIAVDIGRSDEGIAGMEVTWEARQPDGSWREFGQGLLSGGPSGMWSTGAIIPPGEPGPFRARVVVFTTDEPVQHLWQPRRGSYQERWSTLVPGE